MELDDWDLSAEDLDSLERDAFQKIAQQRKPSCSSSSTPSTNEQLNVQPQHSAKHSGNYLERSPAKPSFDSRSERVKLYSFSLLLIFSGSCLLCLCIILCYFVVGVIYIWPVVKICCHFHDFFESSLLVIVGVCGILVQNRVCP